MLKTYKILALLLSYPDKELQEFLPEIEMMLREDALLQENEIEKVAQFVEIYATKNLLQWQGQYVQLFDFSRSVSLHLFEHVHGLSKDRGQAMVDLMDEYAEQGLEMHTGELPDYLPVFLEFLSTRSSAKAAQLLSEPVHIIQAIYNTLDEKENSYRLIFAALVSLSATKPSKAAVDKLLKNQRPLDFDKEYAEEPVTFGGMQNPCKTCK